MPASASFTVFAYLVTTACAILLMKRSSNWRIRFVAFSIGLLPLCQAIILLEQHHVWITADLRHTAEFMQLLASALCLAAVHLLNKENGDRKNTDVRLRVAEATPVPTAAGIDRSES